MVNSTHNSIFKDLQYVQSDDVTKIEAILDKVQTIAIKSSGHKLIFSSCDKEILRPAILKACQNTLVHFQNEKNVDLI